MIPDTYAQGARVKAAITRMVLEYQNKGSYMDLDGKHHSDTAGIVKAWEELDQIEKALK